MKIKIIYDFLDEFGGIERVMCFQANALAKDHDVELLFSYVSKDKEEEFREVYGIDKRIKISQIGKMHNRIFQFACNLINPWRLKNIDADLIISHSFMASLMAEKKKIVDGTKYISFLHHPPNFIYGRNLKWANNLPRFMAYVLGLFAGSIIERMDKIAVRNADLVLVNSKYTKKRIDSIYGLNSSILYPQIDSKFKPENKNLSKKNLLKLGIKKEFVLLHGRIIKDKRPDLAIKAFSEMNLEDIDLVISGTIEEEKVIRRLIADLKLSDRIEVLGRVSEEELVSLYSSAKGFIMPAPKEDFGLTSVEALACGCPVIAWNDGAGPNEIIKKGLNGYLSRPYSIKDFSNNLKKAINKKWNKKTISKSVERFSEKNAKKQLINLVKKIIK